jgi:hypothetical protein
MAKMRQLARKLLRKVLTEIHPTQPHDSYQNNGLQFQATEAAAQWHRSREKVDVHSHAGNFPDLVA